MFAISSFAITIFIFDNLKLSIKINYLYAYTIKLSFNVLYVSTQQNNLLKHEVHLPVLVVVVGEAADGDNLLLGRVGPAPDHRNLLYKKEFLIIKKLVLKLSCFLIRLTRSQRPPSHLFKTIKYIFAKNYADRCYGFILSS